ncbi:MAG: DNA recombination protein RmuC, partial [Terracidiphilus sp.]
MPIWVVGVVAAVAGIIVGFLSRNLTAGTQKALLEQSNRSLTEALNTARSESAQRAGEVLELTRQNSRLESDLGNEKANGERLTQQFKLLAADILKENSKTFSEGSQKELGNLLNPLTEQIKDFRSKVEEAQKESLIGRTALATELNQLKDLNEKLSADAQNLSTALRGSAKAQGDWGEFILRDLLEKAGLREGEQYSFQQSFTGL